MSPEAASIEFTPYRQLGNLTRTHVQSNFQDKDGALWFGCSSGLFRFDRKDSINVTKNGLTLIDRARAPFGHIPKL